MYFALIGGRRRRSMIGTSNLVSDALCREAYLSPNVVQVGDNLETWLIPCRGATSRIVGRKLWERGTQRGEILGLLGGPALGSR